MTIIHNLCIIVILSICVVLTNSYVMAEPHPHSGIIPRFRNSIPSLHLEASDHELLRAGKPAVVDFTDALEPSGRKMLVQDVKAPRDVVWKNILDFDNYKNKNPETRESEVYKHEEMSDGRISYWTRFTVGNPKIYSIEFYTHSIYDPDRNILTWTLDYTKKSSINDNTGYWYIEQHPDNPIEWSRVYFSADISLFRWAPNMIVKAIQRKALFGTLPWVKQHSEKEYSSSRKKAFAF